MLRRFYAFILAVLLAVPALAQVGSGSLKGKIKDRETGEPLPFVNVVVQRNGVQVLGGTTDFEGVYYLKPLEAGSYDVLVTFVGYTAQKRTGVIVKSDKITFLDVELSSGIDLEAVEVVKYTIPLVDRDGGSAGATMGKETIAKMPGRSVNSIVATVGGVSEADANGNVSIRGSRQDGGSFYYIDGIKVRGSNALPKGAIQEVKVITGGLPANYGDATGGIISVTTRGAAREYGGSVELVTSGVKTGSGEFKGLDPFAYTLGEGLISGPLLWKKDEDGKKKDPLLGFFLSANYTLQGDGRPSAIGFYEIDPAQRESLLSNPLTTLDGDGVTYNAEFLGRDAFNKTKSSSNTTQRSVSGQGKFDFNLSPEVNLSVGGSFTYQNDRIYSFANSLANSENNGTLKAFDWRGFARFTQRFKSSAEDAGVIKNAYYSVMVDYSQSKNRQYNEDYDKDFFKYGYVGKFDRFQGAPQYALDTTGTVMEMVALPADTLVTFQPGDLNPDLVRYTNDYFSMFDSKEGNWDSFDVLSNRALRNGDGPQRIYQLWSNAGMPYSTYFERDNRQFRLSGSIAGDVGDHQITLGFEYEQRDDRFYNLNALVSDDRGGVGGRGINLWQIARSVTNAHLRELDRSQPDSTTFLNEAGIFMTQVDYPRLVGSSQSFFDYNLRRGLGMDPRGADLLNVDAMDVNDLKLEYFSPDELLNNGSNIIEYAGYDHLGNRLTTNPTLEDFFTGVDQERSLTYQVRNIGEDTDTSSSTFGQVILQSIDDVNASYNTRAIGAFKPIYFAGYIMDKFAFDDIIFNVGVRIDRFDANQKVLKDKYLFRDAYTVGELNQQLPDAFIPGNIGDDYVVYVDDFNAGASANVVGFRNGDQFFNAQGAEVDAKDVKVSGTIRPFLKSDPAASGNPLSPDAFEDYTPQINVMPRVAFSFPISDEANFTAHYDILTRRPTGANGVRNANQLDLVHYYFINTKGSAAGAPINNPNLRPEKTIDYEIGFQQVVTKSSAIKISAFYREQRDMIQVLQNVGAYPQDYYSFDNIDFGTVKGMTINYDLRRTGNVKMVLNYTLQFADATGSAVGGVVNLNNTDFSTLRVINPTSYDQRHRFNVNLDYRYGSGKDYNGPKLGGKDILANFGANLVGNLGSGTPYSASEDSRRNQLDGSINGSRLPWNFRMDLQLDKDIPLKFGKGDDARTGNLNVYFLMNNLLNRLNIVSVNRGTGLPDDDGYLNDPEYQDLIESSTDEAAYRQYYQLSLLNPARYQGPRVIRIGARLDF